MLKVKASKLDVSLTQNEQRRVERLFIDVWRAPCRGQTRVPQALVDGELVNEGPRSHTYLKVRPGISENPVKQSLGFYAVFLLLKA